MATKEKFFRDGKNFHLLLSEKGNSAIRNIVLQDNYHYLLTSNDSWQAKAFREGVESSDFQEFDVFAVEALTDSATYYEGARGIIEAYKDGCFLVEFGGYKGRNGTKSLRKFKRKQFEFLIEECGNRKYWVPVDQVKIISLFGF